MPQGQFLECMGICHRVENLQQKAKNESTKKHLWSCYERLCSPEEMGANYKIMFIGEKEAGEVYPFMSEAAFLKMQEFFE